MTPEAVWALVGVVVGAILGGGAQILAGYLQGEREKDREKRAATRDLYIDTLRFVADLRRAVDKSIYPLDVAKPEAVIDEVLGLLQEAFRRETVLRAVGTPEVSAAFHVVARAYFGPKFDMSHYRHRPMDDVTALWRRFAEGEEVLIDAISKALS
jgi:hypothetical protein